MANLYDFEHKTEKAIQVVYENKFYGRHCVIANNTALGFPVAYVQVLKGDFFVNKTSEELEDPYGIFDGETTSNDDLVESMRTNPERVLDFVHGGSTFFGERDFGEGYYVGWDYGHNGDYTVNRDDSTEHRYSIEEILVDIGLAIGEIQVLNEMRYELQSD